MLIPASTTWTTARWWTAPMCATWTPHPAPRGGGGPTTPSSLASLRDNIAYANPDAGDEQVVAAAERPGCSSCWTTPTDSTPSWANAA